MPRNEQNILTIAQKMKYSDRIVETNERETMEMISDMIQEIAELGYEKGWDDAMLAVTNSEDL